MGFGLLNRLVNPVVRVVLTSPLHRLLSGRLLLITYTGRVSGRRYTIPVAYQPLGEGIVIRVAAPHAKVWWRNLRQPAPVELRVRGRSVPATARVLEGGADVRVVAEPAA